LEKNSLIFQEQGKQVFFFTKDQTCYYFVTNKNTKACLSTDKQAFLVAGTGFEPKSAAADMSHFREG